MRLLIIIPAYNEEKNIINTIEKINRCNFGYDYIVINDGSTDNTESILSSHSIKHLSLPVNLGLNGAFRAGMVYAIEKGYDCAIQFDGDGQHRPEYIPAMVNEIEKGANIVIGSRFVEKTKDFSPRMIGSRLIQLLIYLKTGKIISDPTSGMRMLDKNKMICYAYTECLRPEPDSLVSQIKNGNVVKELQVTMDDRFEGRSMYANPISSIVYMVKQCISIVFLR